MTAAGVDFKKRFAALWLLGGLFVHLAAGAEEPASTDSDEVREEMLVLPQGELFEPLIADPQWPRFSVEYQWRLGSDEFDRVGAVSFGETFALVRSREHAWGEWEFGLQAKVDAIFDMSKKSFDLSNENYFVGLTGTLLTGGVATQLRIYHLSSHVGDEYLIANGGRRDDVSLEAIDVLVSYEPRGWIRVYGGGGVVINPHQPFDPIITEFGLELTSPRSYAAGLLTPIAGMDIQIRQQNDWIPDIAVLTGVRLARPDNHVRRMEFVVRYYNGRSPDGQFFRQKIESIGLGFRLGF